MRRNTNTHGADGAVCGCGVQTDGRKAVAVDPAIEAANMKRLRRIEGQVRGLQKMAEAMYDELLALIYKHSR